MSSQQPTSGDTPAAADPLSLLRSAAYLRLLVLAALIGVPVSAASYGYLQLTNHMQGWIFTDLPKAVFGSVPTWWAVLPLATAGLLVAMTIRYLPGRGGHSPADGFKAGGVPTIAELPGVALAAIITLGFGVVLGPEAPLIALGGGLAVLALRLAQRDVPAQTGAVVAAAGSFAAISTLLGSPLLGAFLLMEVTWFRGAMLGLVLVPGLLAAGVGSLIFIGLDTWTGLGTTSLVLPSLPAFVRPDVAEFGWAIAIGVLAALAGHAIRRGALLLRPLVERRLVLLMPVVGLVVAGCAIAYAQITGKTTSDVLFSGESQLGPLIAHGAAYSAGVLWLLVACKGLAYSVSMSSFRGGPVFPSMFVGAAAGMALSHLPGLSLVPGVAMGIGAMCVALMNLPLTSVLLATLLLFSNGVAAMPLVIVAVVVAYVVSARLPQPRSESTAAAEPRPAPGPAA